MDASWGPALPIIFASRHIARHKFDRTPRSEVYSVTYVGVGVHYTLQEEGKCPKAICGFSTRSTGFGGSAGNAIVCSGKSGRRTLVSTLILYLKSDRHWLQGERLHFS